MGLNNLWQRTAAANEFARELYPHIGYGFLDQSSIRQEGDLFKADYLMDDLKVLEVTKSGNFFHLKECLGEKVLGSAGGISLDIAIKYAYAKKDEFHSERFQYLVTNYLRKHHVYCSRSKGRADLNPVFVPDGLRLGLEIIETPDISSRLNRLVQSLGHDSPLKVMRDWSDGDLSGQALYLVLLRNGEVRAEAWRMVEFSLPVAHIPTLIPELARLGVLVPRRRNFLTRAYVLNYHLQRPNKLMYRLHHDPEEQMIMVVKGASTIADRDKLICDFRNSALAYIESEKNQN